jgi:hypothetical protein
METLDLFAADDALRRQEAAAKSKVDAEDRQRHYWRVLWDWDGPAVGEICEIDTCVVPTANGRSLYCYTEQVRLIELMPDGRWLAEISMGEVRGKPWHKDGTRVLLGICDIWPPVRAYRRARDESLRNVA